MHTCTSTRVHTRRGGRPGPTGGAGPAGEGGLRSLADGSPGGPNACRACCGLRVPPARDYAHVRVRGGPRRGCRMSPGGGTASAKSAAPGPTAGPGADRSRVGRRGGEAFGGELPARRRIGVSRAGRVGAVGSGAQRAAVGHRPILLAPKFFFTAPAVDSGPVQGARVSRTREAVNSGLASETKHFPHYLGKPPARAGSRDAGHIGCERAGQAGVARLGAASQTLTPPCSRACPGRKG
ncbi:hypothetical protein SGPA1_100005 [Streptomyces misionensis JCM 4497]